MARRRRMPVYTLAKLIVPPVIRFWVRLDMQGALHIPASGPVIVAANHVSYFDPLCLGVFVDSAGRQVRFLAKSELFEKRLMRFIMLGAGQIPVYRETRDASRSLSAAVEAMREGATVAIYPEGTTTRAGRHVGRAPAVHQGQDRPVPARHQGGGPGRPADRAGLGEDATHDELNDARDRVMDAITALVEEARTGWSPPDWYLRRAAGEASSP